MLGYYEATARDTVDKGIIESGRNLTTLTYLDDVHDNDGDLIVYRGMRIPAKFDELTRLAHNLSEIVPPNATIDDNAHAALVALGQTIHALDSLAPSAGPVQLTLDTYTSPRQIKPLTYMVESEEPISRAQAIAAAVRHAGNKARDRSTRDAQAFNFCIHTQTARQWQVVLEE